MKKLECFLFILITILFTSCASQKAAKTMKENGGWTGSWATAPQLVEPNNMPPEPGLSGNTLRQIVRVSIGGTSLRLRFSNKYSNSELDIKSVTIASALKEDEIVPNNLKYLKFNGKEEITIPANGEVFSDELKFSLQPNSLLAITIHYGKTPSDLTGHPGSRTTSFLVKGSQEQNVKFQNPVKTDHWYTIMGIDVKSAVKASTIAVLGNSITDGRGSGTNKQNRWTDILSQRLLTNKKTANIGVLNFGIGGNCVLRGGLGPTALDRFDYNILSQQGVKWLIILEGINDIGGIRDENLANTVADELIMAYQTMIEKAHKSGIKVYGATILPFAKSFYDKPFRQEARTKVNTWIRNSGAVDAVIDFDQLMESEEKGVIKKDLQDNDFLHPNEAGYKTMGDFINLKLFKK